MDENSFPKPLPRRNLQSSADDGRDVGPTKKPVPLPRSRDKATSSGLLGSPEPQISNDIGDKLHSGHSYVRDVKQMAGNKLERTIKGTKRAKQKLQDSVRNSTKSVRSKVTRSFGEKTSLETKSKSPDFVTLRKDKLGETVLTVPHQDRCVSLPVADMGLFDTIQFNSPLQDQHKYEPINLDTRDVSLSSSSTPFLTQQSSSDTNYNHEFSSTSSFPLASRLSNTDTNSNSNTEDQTYDLPRSNSLAVESLYGNLYHSSENVSAEGSVTCINPIYENKEDNSSTANDNIIDLLIPQIQRARNNSYENWNITKENVGDSFKNTRPSQSIMLEFDPLLTNELPTATQNDSSSSNSLMIDNSSEHNSDESDSDYWGNSVSYLSPPTPPERIDSLPDEVATNVVRSAKAETPRCQTEWFLDSPSKGSNEAPNTQVANRSSSVMEMFSSMLKIVPESASYLKKKIDPENNSVIPSKLILPTALVHHRGLMVRFLPRGIDDLLKKFPLRTCFLSDHKLTFYQENYSAKEVYHMKNLYSIQIILAHNFNFEGELHCFLANFSNSSSFMNRGSVVFGCANESERNLWMRRIIELFSDVFPAHYVANVTRFGWCYLKEGVSAAWDAAWLLLRGRTLHYYNSQDVIIRNLDLRKARCFVLQQTDEKKTDKNEHLLLDFQDLTLYLRMGASRETRLWFKILKAVACNNGSSIHHQQLTKDDIPTIVDKCINFIYAKGSLTQGIYRKAGSSSEIRTLLKAFRANAWDVQLAARTHSEHDVANTLKRFFRDLPESLIPPSQHSAYCDVTDLLQDQKVKAYKDLIKTLKPINQNTLMKLMSHLHFISSLSEENLMNATNLATVWGPTLMRSPNSSDGKWLAKETEVVYDFIDLYLLIYEPSRADIEKESKMLKVLKQCQTISTNPIQKRSGDLHVWIYLKEKQAGNCVNVVLTPGRTSGDVCIELSSKIGTEAHLLMVEEIICNENMSRPLHHTESLFDVVLRWGYWDEIDRKDNYLVVKDNTIMCEAAAICKLLPPKSTLVLNQEVKFANEKSKSFSPCKAEFKENVLTCFKEKPASVIGNWNIQDIRWYIGHETKRNPQSKWSITFIQKYNKPVRSKDKAWFGCTLSGYCLENRLPLISAFLKAEFTADILPTPQLIVT